MRGIEIIEEAARKIPRETRDEHPEIEWKKISGRRDRLIHDYGGVDYLIVWDVAKIRVPQLTTQIWSIVQVGSEPE